MVSKGVARARQLIWPWPHTRSSTALRDVSVTCALAAGAILLFWMALDVALAAGSGRKGTWSRTGVPEVVMGTFSPREYADYRQTDVGRVAPGKAAGGR